MHESLRQMYTQHRAYFKLGPFLNDCYKTKACRQGLNMQHMKLQGRGAEVGKLYSGSPQSASVPTNLSCGGVRVKLGTEIWVLLSAFPHSERGRSHRAEGGGSVNPNAKGLQVGSSAGTLQDCFQEIFSIHQKNPCKTDGREV